MRLTLLEHLIDPHYFLIVWVFEATVYAQIALSGSFQDITHIQNIKLFASNGPSKSRYFKKPLNWSLLDFQFFVSVELDNVISPTFRTDQFSGFFSKRFEKKVCY